MDHNQLNDMSRSIWDRKADFWDKLHGDEGNVFHRAFVSPAVERLLALQPSESILDVACGNGTMARKLAALGAKVTAVDFSAALVKKAQARAQIAGEPILYKVCDATDEQALVALGEGMFDAVVCTMALMDMAVIVPFFRAAKRLLRAGGRLVIATAHPAFNSCNPTFFVEREDTGGQLLTKRGLKITEYLDVPQRQGVGAPDEPAPHYYFHRPLHELLGEAFHAGLVLDGIEEPGIRGENYDPEQLLLWASMSQIPPVFAARLRPT